MKFTLLVQGSPYSSEACFQALQFSKALIQNNHTLKKVLFYNDAVYIAVNHFSVPTDERNIQQEWIDFGSQNKVQLFVCVAAANRRGIIENACNFAFDSVGLGCFVETMNEVDRVVSFK